MSRTPKTLLSGADVRVTGDLRALRIHLEVVRSAERAEGVGR